LDTLVWRIEAPAHTNLSGAPAERVRSCGLERLVILSRVRVAEVLPDRRLPLDHQCQRAVNDATDWVGHLDLKLPALNAEHVIQPLSDCTSVCVGEGHPSAPRTMLQIFLLEWCC
jgi:hypothetical protein